MTLLPLHASVEKFSGNIVLGMVGNQWEDASV